jgi:hypothetical protein
MARTMAKLPGGARLADYLALGYLAMNCPLDRVRAVLAANSAASQRYRGLPHEVLVYFVMAMNLYATVAYEEVLRCVVEGLRQFWGDSIKDVVVSKAAITAARQRVGVEPLKQLYAEQVKPIGPAGMAGVWYHEFRVMAIDGSTLDLPDEEANRTQFGYPGASRGETAFPQLRFVALAECGTHILSHAVPGAYRDSELKLAESVIAHVDSTMLLTADRGFFGYGFWNKCLASGAKLLFRVKANLRLPREQELSDGSFLSTLYPNDTDRRHRRNGIVVRVVEYALDGIADAEPVYRLVTNWLDPAAAPAAELAALYHRRWKIETAFDEAKIHLLDGRATLRSKTPDLVLQEFYAWMITHAAIRRMMLEAAGGTGQAAEDLSYVHAVRVLKRRLPASLAIPP